MKPGRSTTALSGMQQRNIFGGQAMQGWRLFDGNDPPTPPPPPPPPPPTHHTPPPPPPPVRHEPPPVHSDNIADVRAEAAAYRIRARDATTALEAERARVAQIESDANRRVQEAEERAQVELNRSREKTRSATLREEATAAGIRDMDLVALIEREHGSTITFDAQGNVLGVKEAVDAYKAKKPEYFEQRQAPPPPPPSRTGPPGPTPTPQNSPPPSTVQTIPKTAEGKRQYAASKADALRALR